jgi:hypothetical protein
MTLSEKQIHYIDNYLKNQGVSYWDIRLELIDHIACEMEQKEGSYDFDNLLSQTLNKLGWDRSLKDLQNRKLKSINAKFRAAYYKNFLSLFTSLKSITIVLVGVFLYYLVMENSPQWVFNLTTIILFLTPIGIITIHYAVSIFKLKKSGYVFYAYFYVIFAMLITNLFYQFPKPGGIIDVSLVTRNTIVFVATVFNVLFTVGGIKIYIKTFKEFNAVYQKLVS